jgi:formamidopyrimidine-DNA glycosylase
MPELPSVEIFKNYFDSTALHQKIKKVEIRSPEILINTTPHELRKTLSGLEFIGSWRYGKYLFCHLSNDYFMIIHFGMTGYLKYSPKNSTKNYSNHIRLLIQFINADELAFDDMRKFGKIGLTKNPDNFIREKNLGPDALEINFKTFKELFKNRKGIIKSLIMNQNFIAGIGNLYADEILYQSQIHPLTTADKLKKDDLENLFKDMKMVLNKAIEYQDSPHSMPSNFLLAHRYQGGECPQGGALTTLKVGGRTTYLCPNHQKRVQ